MYQRIGGRALIFAGWLVSATLYAGTIVDREDGYQPANVARYGWQNLQDVCPYNGSHFVCPGSNGAMGLDPIGWYWSSVEDVDLLLDGYEYYSGNVAASVTMINSHVSLEQDTATTPMSFSLSSTEQSRDEWLSQYSSVSNPATVAFIGISLVGLGWSRPTKT